MLAGWVRRMGRYRWFVRLGKTLVPVDRQLGRLTGGRFVALNLRALPSLLIETTGRRTGQPRVNPLLYVPDGDAFVVIGSNWGQRQHPAWAGNLLANRAAVVTIDGRRIPVRARLVLGDERERLRTLLLDMWPAYADYERRAGGRELRIFRLDPAADRPGRDKR